MDTGDWLVDFQAMSLPRAHYVWSEPDRRTLYRAVSVLTSRKPTRGRLVIAVHALLSDLEIYDDPRQGVGRWLFPDEVALLEELGEDLHRFFGAGAGAWVDATFLRDPDSQSTRDRAEELKQRMEANGAGCVPG